MRKPDDFRAEYEFAVALAKRCGEMARTHFDPDIRFEPKGDNSPLTAADIAINRYVIEQCQQYYPTVGILGEEESSVGSDEHLLWVCDPIDGTSPYAFGMAASTFCLALVRDGQPVIGIIYDFMNDRLFRAAKGKGAFLNDTPIEQPQYPPMKLINFEWWSGAAVEIHGFHERMFAKGYQVPNYTSTGFMGVQAATGRIAGVVYAGKSAWDVAALKVIAEECGCKVRSLEGNEQAYNGEITGAIIARPDMYDEILQALKDSRA